MKQKIGIVGAGILGRLFALRLSSMGYAVTLIDQNGKNDTRSSSFVAAGMLAPFCELESSNEFIHRMGLESLEIWPKILNEYQMSVFLQRAGSLVIAHSADAKELERFQKQIQQKIKNENAKRVSSREIRELEPEVDSRILEGIYFPFEGQIDAQGLLIEMYRILESRNVRILWNHDVSIVRPFEIVCRQDQFKFDLVLDCRGIGAQLAELRAVRGELIHVEAPDVRLKRPIRLMHPRYPLYIVPRPGQRYIIGATEVESEDLTPISVRSTLELLSAAYSVHSGFSEARILETRVGLRPAFPNHIPRIQCRNGLIEVNGLYRHGYLISPKLTEAICQLIASGRIDDCLSPFFEELSPQSED